MSDNPFQPGDKVQQSRTKIRSLNNMIQHTHNGTVITYDEKNNKWLFELRGRSRSAESLAKAKEYIDKPVTEKEEKPFNRKKAWLWHSYQEPVVVDITSIAELDRYGSETPSYFWVVRDGNRSKESTLNLSPHDERNTQLVKEYLELTKQIAALSKQQEKIRSKVTRLKV